MGCTLSKQSVCQNCHAQYSPVRISYSSVPNHSPPHEDGSHHVVALTSTTLGYIMLDSSIKGSQSRQDPVLARILEQPVRGNVPQKNNEELAVGVIEAKTWSKMIDEKITKIVPKTPIVTPPGEPETINAWELMEGLDDSHPSPLQLPSAATDVTDVSEHISRFSFSDTLNLVQLDQTTSPSNSNSNDTSTSSSIDLNNSIQKVENEMVSRNKEKLILYFTSLRGVRKTYEDCCHVRAILKSSGVRVDERDVSMHSGFKDELKELLGDGYNSGGLPKVFVGKKYIGGGDEIRRFHEEYQLDKMLEGCEMVDGRNGDDGGGGGAGGGDCEVCGDIRFVPCETCSGSCKVYYEVNSDVGDDEEVEESDCGFQRCPDCNENGLIRCPICCD